MNSSSSRKVKLTNKFEQFKLTANGKKRGRPRKSWQQAEPTIDSRPSVPTTRDELLRSREENTTTTKTVVSKPMSSKRQPLLPLICDNMSDHIMDDLQYSFLELCFIQISKLKEEVQKEDRDRQDKRSWDRHRLFRHNVFEDIDPSEKQYLDELLCHSLKTLGAQLHNNLDPFAKKKTFNIVDKRDPNNYDYDEFGVIHLKPKDCIKFSVCLPKKQALMLHVTAKILTLLQSGRYMTNRELYYKSLELCNSNTARLTAVLDDLCCLLGCSRIHLHILCQSKGIVYGDLKFKLKTGEIIDCLSNKEGTKLPTPCTPIVDIVSNARFVIIIEKDSVLQKILGQESSTNFIERYQVILFTAKGYPDINSRAFVNLIWTKLRIPILALTDADPHGFEIVCCYKFGCYATASEAAYLAVPCIRWLGLLPSDVKRHSLPISSTLALTDNDIKKLNSLMKRPYLQQKFDWINQLKLMREINRKAELESLDIDGEYLVRTYLPNKLRYASWL